MNVAILTARPTGGAEGDDVAGMLAFFSARGADARIFAPADAGAGVTVHPLAELAAFCAAPESAAIYHSSESWPGALQLVASLPCRKVLKHHGSSSPEPLEGLGGELRALAAAPFDAFLADSSQGRSALVAHGAAAGRAAVVPPFHRVEAEAGIEADLAFLDRYSDELLNVLAVGPVVPGQGHRLLLEGFAGWHHQHHPRSRLLVIGPLAARWSAYWNGLFALAKELQVQDSALFLGELAPAALKAAWLCADVFMTCGDQEAWCAPAVRALSLSVPILARGSAALPEIVGGGGLVLGEQDPAWYSASLQVLGEDQRAREALGVRGRSRYAERFSPISIGRQLAAGLARGGVHVPA